MLRDLLPGWFRRPSRPAAPVVGCLATMPSRLDSLPIMLASILPQLDRLYVFLDGFAEVPGCLAGRPNCLVEHIPAGSGLHNASRFLVPEREGPEAIFVCLDDDIVYPADYVVRLVAGLERHGRRALVGIHGGLFRPPHASYVRDCEVLHFAARLGRDTRVDVLGSGTLAFHASTLQMRPESWRHPRFDDLSLAVDAAAAGVELVALGRPKKWLRPIAQSQPDSLWRSIKRDDRLATRLMRDIVAIRTGRMPDRVQAASSQNASWGPGVSDPAGM
ncbi:MAG: glycosyltransferase family 2 protein [Thiobacillus sp.]|nr:glycosyltransferase family 2 protein [Thiobacillus sp.]